jgi:hypothetical protein
MAIRMLDVSRNTLDEVRREDLCRAELILRPFSEHSSYTGSLGLDLPALGRSRASWLFYDLSQENIIKHAFATKLVTLLALFSAALVGGSDFQ